LVGEDPEDNGVRLFVLPQPLGAGPSRGLVSLGLVVAFDVRAQRAFLGVRAGGLVVGGLVGWHQQRGERVDDRGLAGADVTGQQSGLSARTEPPDLAVERAPVQDLRVLQPVTGPSSVPVLDRG
jgi:hypothetical protein